MPVYDWYCALSVAVDREEDQRQDLLFAAYVAGGYDPKKFRIPKRNRHTIPVDGTKSRPDVLGELRKSGLAAGAIKGNLDEYAQMRGLKKVFQLADGTFADENGNPIMPPAGSVFVPVKK